MMKKLQIKQIKCFKLLSRTQDIVGKIQLRKFSITKLIEN